MSKLDYEISEKYTSEIEDIRCKLNQLENGKIKEFTGAKQDGMEKECISNMLIHT